MIVLPFLLMAGVPPLNALATNKFQSVGGTASSTINFMRRGHLDLRPLLPSVLCAIVGSAIGAFTVQSLPLNLLETLLPYLLIILALYFAFSPRVSDQDSAPRLSFRHFHWLVGGGIGLYGGFFGPGMGSFLAIAFVSLLGFNMGKATAATKPLILATNGTAMLVFVFGGYVVWELAIPMTIAQIVGARIGSAMVMKSGTALVKPLIIFVTIAIAFHLTVDFIFRSILRSPGKSGSSLGKIVFTNGVFVLKGSLAPLDWANAMSASSKKPALLFPCSSKASSIDSNHSCVS